MNDFEHPSHKYTTLVTFLFLLTVAIGVSLWMTALYLTALIIAWIFASISQPVFIRLSNRGVHPKLAAAALTLVVLLLVIAPLALFAMMAVQQAILVSQAMMDSDRFSVQEITSQINRLEFLEPMGWSLKEISTQLRLWIQSGTQFGANLALNLAAHLPDIILQIVLTAIAYYFMLMDGPRFLDWIGRRIPFDVDVRQTVVKSFVDTAAASIWATLAAGIAQGMVLFVGFLALGVPGAFLAGGLTFVFSWIPLIGTLPVWVVGALYLYAHQAYGKVGLMIVFGLISGLVDNLVRPLVLKGRSNMHPLVSLVAIFGGIGFFGIMGVFLGPILVAVMIALIAAWPGVADRFGIMPKIKL